MAWFAADRQGSVESVFDNSGAVLASATYDPFGNILSGGVWSVAGYGFQGGSFDSATGLENFGGGGSGGGRWYDSVSMQWLREDSLGLTPDANPRRFVGNDPTNGTDPSGQWIIVPRTVKNAQGESLADEWARWFRDGGIRVANAPLVEGTWGTGYNVLLFHPEDREKLKAFLKNNEELYKAAFGDQREWNVIVDDKNGNTYHYMTYGRDNVDNDDLRWANYRELNFYKNLEKEYREKGWDKYIPNEPVQMTTPGGPLADFTKWKVEEAVKNRLHAEAASLQKLTDDDRKVAEAEIRTQMAGAVGSMDTSSELQRRHDYQVEQAWRALDDAWERIALQHAVIAGLGGVAYGPTSVPRYVARPQMWGAPVESVPRGRVQPLDVGGAAGRYNTAHGMSGDLVAPGTGAPKFRVAQPGEAVNIGRGDALQHFTDAKGAAGITGVPEDVLAGLKPGQQVVVDAANFKPGVNPFGTGEGGGVGVTKLGSDALPGQLDGIGVFGAKQQYVIEFSQETVITNGVQMSEYKASRSMWSLPGDTTLKGTITIKKLR